MKPWFENTRVAKIVRAAVLTRRTVEDLCKRPLILKKETGIPKATAAEIKQAVKMKADWDGETTLKVKILIEAGRGYGYRR